MELKNSVSIITGGSSGLGEATVRKFHSLGSKVCVFDLDNERGEKLERELGENCAYFSVDVCHEANIKEAINAVIKQFNKIIVGGDFNSKVPASYSPSTGDNVIPHTQNRSHVGPSASTSTRAGVPERVSPATRAPW